MREHSDLISNLVERIKMIGLTDKEIQKALNEFGGFDLSLIESVCEFIAKAQIKKVYEWLKGEVLEDCHESYSNVMCFHRRALKELEEVKE